MTRLLAATLVSAALAATAPALAQGPAVQIDQQPVLLDRDSVLARLTSLYPPSLLASRAGGTTHVGFVVRIDGTTAEARVLDPSPHPALDSAALAVVAGMRFTPARFRGTAVAAPVTLPITFAAPPEDAVAPEEAPGDFTGTGNSTGTGDFTGTGEGLVPAPTAGELPAPDEEARTLNLSSVTAAVVHELGSMGRTDGEMVATLRIRVSAEGRPLEIQLRRSSGRPDYDRAALHAAERLRFRPARRDGAAVEAWKEVPVGIRIRTDSRP